MPDSTRLRRAGEDALRVLVDLLPTELDPRAGQEYVTLVFVDVEGFSSHVAAGGDDAALEVVHALDEAVAAAMAGRRLRVVKRLGDGLMLAARDPEDALTGTLEMVSAFHEATYGLRLRAGAHRGTVRRQGLDYLGYHVNLAARVAEGAVGGQVLVTSNVLAGIDLDELDVHAAAAGRLRGKGVNGEVELFEISGTPIVERGLLPALRRTFGSWKGAEQTRARVV